MICVREGARDIVHVQWGVGKWRKVPLEVTSATNRSKPEIRLTAFPLVNLTLYFIHTSTMSFLPAIRRQAALTARRSYATVSEAAGVKVVGIDSGVLPAATTSITVVVKAGARYETQPGIAHVLKNFAFKVSTRMTTLM